MSWGCRAGAGGGAQLAGLNPQSPGETLLEGQDDEDVVAGKIMFLCCTYFLSVGTGFHASAARVWYR